MKTRLDLAEEDGWCTVNDVTIRDDAPNVEGTLVLLIALREDTLVGSKLINLDDAFELLVHLVFVNAL